MTDARVPAPGDLAVRGAAQAAADQVLTLLGVPVCNGSGPGGRSRRWPRGVCVLRSRAQAPGVRVVRDADRRYRRNRDGPPDDVVGAGGWLGGGELIYEVISCAGCWEWLWVKWCGAVGSAGAVHAARHVGQAPLACPIPGTVRVAEVSGVKGGPQAVAQRSR